MLKRFYKALAEVNFPFEIKWHVDGAKVVITTYTNKKTEYTFVRDRIEVIKFFSLWSGSLLKVIRPDYRRNANAS